MSRAILVAAWILLLLAAAEFVIRGPVRYLQGSGWNDLAQYYTASRLWLRGQNFTSGKNFAALWRDELHTTFSDNTVRVRIAPPPGTLVLFAPLGALSWHAALFTWLAVLLLSFAATVWALKSIAGLTFSDPRGIAFIAGCLALAPFHTGIAAGNQTILVIALCALGIWAAKADGDFLAGLCFGLACSMKPHIGAFFVLYYLINRRWRLFIAAIALTAVLVLLAAAWMQFTGVHWLSDYLNNIRFGASKNTIDDFTVANQIRFMLINLQVPFYSLTHNARWSNLLALLVGGALIAVWTALVLRSKQTGMELLVLASIAVIGLLPLYHRLYDATVLAIPLCWCLSRKDHLKRTATIALILMAPFLVPGAAVLQQMARRGRIPATWTDSWWWNCVLMPHQTWLLLLLSLTLLYGMVQQQRGRLKPTT